MPYLLFNILVDLHNFLMHLGGWIDYWNALYDWTDEFEKQNKFANNF